jgi:uncharacterized protein
LKEAVEAVRAHYGDLVDSIVLFGSRARGDHGPESDYDIAVFLKTLDRRCHEKDALFDIKRRLLEKTDESVTFVPLSRTDRRGTELRQYDIDHEAVLL